MLSIKSFGSKFLDFGSIIILSSSEDSSRISDIKFNFIAASLMVYLLVNVIIEPGQMSPETRDFSEGVGLVQVHELANYFGISIAVSPFNISLISFLVSFDILIYFC